MITSLMYNMIRKIKERLQSAVMMMKDHYKEAIIVKLTIMVMSANFIPDTLNDPCCRPLIEMNE